MTNLRKVSGYNIGLDLGTGSVGWAVTDLDGDLLYFNGKPTWGSRIFPSAETAAGTRMNRGQRRRYVRRRWRLNLLQSLFSAEMSSVDADFFTRLNQSRLLKEDRAEECQEYRWPFFNGSDFTEADYYNKFPTIYHLRVWLMETDEKADLRLVYLAFHNIVKARGNFLHQDNPSLSSSKADMGDSVLHLCNSLSDWCASNESEPTLDREEIQRALENATLSRGQKQEIVQRLLGIPKTKDKDPAKVLSQAFVGFKTDFGKLFSSEAESPKFKLSEDEKVDAYRESLSDDDLPLFDAACEVYSSFVLMGILSSGSEPITSGALQNATGRTISYCKVREYEKYKADLRLLKDLVREYAPKQYNSFFRGEFYPTLNGKRNMYDPAKAKGYTRYDVKRGSAYDDFVKETKKLFEGTKAVEDPRYQQMISEFDEDNFLRRLKTSDNGSIPYQLHLEEMDAVINNQGRYYPFLIEEKEKLESLVSFRIPYYVGPLTQKNAAKKPNSDEARFAWAKRLPGKNGEIVYPWNWDQVIDKNSAAHAFINRMTSDCTYLLEEPVLPKCSLLYEEFCVLNELNGARYSVDGDDWRRFDYADRRGIIEDLFYERRTVTYKAVEDWLRRSRGWAKAHVRGGQGETKFESTLNSYRFFCKDVFRTNELPGQDLSIVETIILWNTLFEDRSILKEELQRHFGEDSPDPRLSNEQIKAICRKRFTGWGKLSEKLLVGLKAQTDNGPKSIMDVMREGDPAAGGRSRAMVFMEVLHEENLGFEKLIERENEEKLSGMGALSIDELPGSPALRRTVNQATRIVKEITRIAGHAPNNVFIETTRDEDDRNKGRRTRRRYETIKEAVDAFR